MRIEGYPIPAHPVSSATARSTQHTASDGCASSAKFEFADEVQEVSPQERLRRALDERRWVAEAAFDSPIVEGELGKHIDLRV